MKFFPRHFLTFTPLIILPIVLIGGMAMWNNRWNHQKFSDLRQNISRLEQQADMSSKTITNAFEEKTRADYEYIIHHIKLGLELSLDHLDRVLQNFADFPNLRRYLNHPAQNTENDTQLVFTYLRTLIKSHQISNIYILDQSGKERIRLKRNADQIQSLELRPDSALSNKPFISEWQSISQGRPGIIGKKVYFDHDLLSLKKAQPLISLLAPVYSMAPLESNRTFPISGYIRFVIPVSFLTDKIVGNISTEDSIVIINRRGEIVFHQNPSEIGNNFLKYSAFKDKFLVFSDFVTGGLLQINIFADKEILSRKTEGVKNLTQSISLQVDTINTLSEHLKKHLDMFRQGLILILALALLSAVAIVYATAKVFSAPIKHLIRQAGKISAGELDSGLTSSASDEIGELSRHLDEMRINLKAHITDLDKKVLARTTELTKSNEQLHQEIVERKHSEVQKERLIADLQSALTEIKDLRGILPLCSFCKKIRDDKGYWQQVDVYIQKHSQADISHSLCPDCLKEHYPNLSETMARKNKQPPQDNHM